MSSIGIQYFYGHGTRGKQDRSAQVTVLLTNDNNKIFLAKVNKIYTKNLPKNDIENSEYLKISNNKIVEEIYRSYDLALSKKYKVKVFQNTLDRIKNNFK